MNNGLQNAKGLTTMDLGKGLDIVQLQDLRLGQVHQIMMAHQLQAETSIEVSHQVLESPAK